MTPLKIKTMDLKNIIVAGDSIARGYGDADGYYAWPMMIVPRLAARLNTNIGVVNLSVGGASSPQISGHFKAVIANVELLVAIIFAFGANDIKHLGPNRSAPFNILVHDRERIWRDMFGMAAAQKPGVPLFALGVMPIDQAVYDDQNNGLNVYRCNEDIDAYNQALQLVCSDMGVHYIDAAAGVDHAAWRATLLDGIHSDGRGQGMLADQVYQALERVL